MDIHNRRQGPTSGTCCRPRGGPAVPPVTPVTPPALRLRLGQWEQAPHGTGGGGATARSTRRDPRLGSVPMQELARRFLTSSGIYRLCRAAQVPVKLEHLPLLRK